MDRQKFTEQLICMSRVHSQAASYVANQLGMDVSNFHSYLQHPTPKSKPQSNESSLGEEKAQVGESPPVNDKLQKRRSALKLSESMKKRLCELFKFSETGFTEPMLDSWLVRSDEDWERLSKCFDIYPLLIIDSTESITRLNLVKAEQRFGLQLYKPKEAEPDTLADGTETTETNTSQSKRKSDDASYMYQFALVKVVVGETWRAVLVRMTGLKLQKHFPQFWAASDSERAVFHYPKRQQLFHLQHSLDGINSNGSHGNKNSELSFTQYTASSPPREGWHAPQSSNPVLNIFIKQNCYPIIQERLEKRFDVERPGKIEPGTPKHVLLNRSARLRRYAQIVRTMFSLDIDPLNHLGGSIMLLGEQRAEVEVGCVFEEDHSLIMRERVHRRPDTKVIEYLIVLREYKNGIIELVYNGPRDALIRHSSRSIYFDKKPQPVELITKRVRQECKDEDIQWREVSLTELRLAHKHLPIEAHLQSPQSF